MNFGWSHHKWMFLSAGIKIYMLGWGSLFHLLSTRIDFTCRCGFLKSTFAGTFVNFCSLFAHFVLNYSTSSLQINSVSFIGWKINICLMADKYQGMALFLMSNWSFLCPSCPLLMHTGPQIVVCWNVALTKLLTLSNKYHWCLLIPKTVYSKPLLLLTLSGTLLGFYDLTWCVLSEF